MYLAKERGRNNFQFFDHGLSARYSERLELENRLRHALDEQQLALSTSPRWDPFGRADRHGSPDPLAPARRQHDPARQVHPDRRRMRPDRAHRRLGAAGGLPAGPGLAAGRHLPGAGGVNLSARQFDDAGLLATIQSALADASLAPAYLDLELTESLVMRNPEHTRSVLAECKKLGLQLSVDDFGTGYSSLANLKRFPIDRLKIDRSFIKDIVTEPDDAAIAQTIVAMAHTLRLK
jgi:predicted signal transduction protein with EAL and GGDEF domain